MDFESKLNSWLEQWQAKINAQYETQYANLTPPTLEQERGSKFIRIVKREPHGGSASAFVALADGQTKALGTYKAGDIFKPAGYKGPAKHARGNIFDESNGMKWMSEYGPAYLR